MTRGKGQHVPLPGIQFFERKMYRGEIDQAVKKWALKVPTSKKPLLIILQASVFPWPVPASLTQSSFLLSSTSRRRSTTHKPPHSSLKRTTFNACTYTSSVFRVETFLVGRMSYRIGYMSGEGAQILFLSFFFSSSLVIARIALGRTAYA